MVTQKKMPQNKIKSGKRSQAHTQLEEYLSQFEDVDAKVSYGTSRNLCESTSTQIFQHWLPDFINALLVKGVVFDVELIESILSSWLGLNYHSLSYSCIRLVSSPFSYLRWTLYFHILFHSYRLTIFSVDISFILFLSWIRLIIALPVVVAVFRVSFRYLISQQSQRCRLLIHIILHNMKHLQLILFGKQKSMMSSILFLKVEKLNLEDLEELSAQDISSGKTCQEMKKLLHQQLYVLHTTSFEIKQRLKIDNSRPQRSDSHKEIEHAAMATELVTLKALHALQDKVLNQQIPQLLSFVHTQSFLSIFQEREDVCELGGESNWRRVADALLTSFTTLYLTSTSYAAMYFSLLSFHTTLSNEFKAHLPEMVDHSLGTSFAHYQLPSLLTNNQDTHQTTTSLPSAFYALQGHFEALAERYELERAVLRMVAQCLQQPAIASYCLSPPLLPARSPLLDVTTVTDEAPQIAKQLEGKVEEEKCKEEKRVVLRRIEQVMHLITTLYPNPLPDHLPLPSTSSEGHTLTTHWTELLRLLQSIRDHIAHEISPSEPLPSSHFLHSSTGLSMATEGTLQDRSGSQSTLDQEEAVRTLFENDVATMEGPSAERPTGSGSGSGKGVMDIYCATAQPTASRPSPQEASPDSDLARRNAIQHHRLLQELVHSFHASLHHHYETLHHQPTQLIQLTDTEDTTVVRVQDGRNAAECEGVWGEVQKVKEAEQEPVDDSLSEKESERRAREDLLLRQEAMEERMRSTGQLGMYKQELQHFLQLAAVTRGAAELGDEDSDAEESS